MRFLHVIMLKLATCRWAKTQWHFSLKIVVMNHLCTIINVCGLSKCVVNGNLEQVITKKLLKSINT
jgi:hypothetical protein